MNMIHTQPWNFLDEISREMTRGLRTRTPYRRNTETPASDWVPAVDIKEEENQFLILADVPGVEPKDIEVHMEDNILSIKGTRASATEEEKEGYKRTERVTGSFTRRFTLPETANPEKITAKTEHGVLKIEIPKHEKLQPRRIEVQG